MRWNTSAAPFAALAILFIASSPATALTATSVAVLPPIDGLREGIWDVANPLSNSILLDGDGVAAGEVIVLDDGTHLAFLVEVSEDVRQNRYDDDGDTDGCNELEFGKLDSSDKLVADFERDGDRFFKIEIEYIEADGTTPVEIKEGDETQVIEATTSLAYNLNNVAFNILDSQHLLPGWQDPLRYEFKVEREQFVGAGEEVMELTMHISPSCDRGKAFTTTTPIEPGSPGGPVPVPELSAIVMTTVGALLIAGIAVLKRKD